MGWQRQQIVVELSRQVSMQVISIKLATTVDHFLRDLDFGNIYKAGPILFYYTVAIAYTF